MEQFRLVGQDAIDYIVENGDFSYLYTSIIKTEEQFIKGIAEWIKFLQDEGYYPSEESVDVAVSWNKDKASCHQVIVEAYGENTKSEGFGKNWQTVILEIDGEDKEYKVIGGQFSIDVDISCVSTNRTASAMIADMVLMGLQSNIDNYLGSVGIQIPANAVKMTGKINRLELVSSLALWETPVNVNGITVSWEQLTEVNGELLKNYKYYISKSEST